MRVSQDCQDPAGEAVCGSSASRSGSTGYPDYVGARAQHRRLATDGFDRFEQGVAATSQGPQVVARRRATPRGDPKLAAHALEFDRSADVRQARLRLDRTSAWIGWVRLCLGRSDGGLGVEELAFAGQAVGVAVE